MIHSPFYTAYMASDAWKNKRAERLRLDEFTCQGCGAANHLDVHHKHYSTLGNEDLSDLVVVCRFCHGEIHRVQRASGYYLEPVTEFMLSYLQKTRGPAKLSDVRGNNDSGVTMPSNVESAAEFARTEVFKRLKNRKEDAEVALQTMGALVFDTDSLSKSQRDGISRAFREFNRRWPEWVVNNNPKTARKYFISVANAPDSLDFPSTPSRQASSPGHDEEIALLHKELKELRQLEPLRPFLDQAPRFFRDSEETFAVLTVCTKSFDNPRRPGSQQFRFIRQDGVSGIASIDNNGLWPNEPFNRYECEEYANGSR